MPNTPNQSLSNWLDDFQSTHSQMGNPPQNPSPPKSIADSIDDLPNSDKLLPSERFIYGKLPGVANSPIGKLLSSFAESPAGKILNVLDYGAEGLERTLGVLAQYRDRKPDEEFKLKDAWSAGSLFYDVSRLPRIRYDANGKAVGIRIDEDMPGAYAITEARKQLEQGKTLEEVRDVLYGNMGALALRGQLNDTLGHIALDPFVWLMGAVKPVESLHALRNLALTGKMDVNAVKALETEARLAGNIADAEKFAAAVAKAEEQGKALTRTDKFVISLTGGTPWLTDTSKMSKTEKLVHGLQTSKLNPFALTPQARASEFVDMIAANVENRVITNWNADPEDFEKLVSSAARGAIGEQWGHLASTIQGRATQGVLSNSDAVVRKLGLEWGTYKNERSLLNRLAGVMPGMDERKLWKLAKENPKLLFEQVVQALKQEIGDETVLKAVQDGTLHQGILENIGKIDNSIPLMKEEFYAKALMSIEDVAMRQSVLQFGIKEKGLLTLWSDRMKAWESIPFIKANPANAIRNVVNNDITLIGRGVYGTMSDAAIHDFWKGKHMPAVFERGFGFGVEKVEGEVAGFDPGNAMKALNEALTGGKQDKIIEAAKNVKLGAFDFSEWSSKAERAASRRASTMGWIQFHQQHWNPRTGFTSISKHLDPETLDKMEAAIPGITGTLDEIAQASGADAAKFAELMKSNIEHNFTTILKNTADGLGYKVEDVLGADIIHVLQEGLPRAIENNNVHGFVDSLRLQMEQHVDEMFDKHVENLPGIIAAQVQAGGGVQFHRIFGKAVDELWAGNTEHALRMSSINELIDEARDVKDWDRVNSMWSKIQSDGENHFRRIWKKFDAYQAGLEQGAKNAGIKYPGAVRSSFKDMSDGWKSFFEFRNNAYRDFFEASKTGKPERTLQEIQTVVDTMFEKLNAKEDGLYQKIDDLMAKSLDDPTAKQMYMTFRDQASQLRNADRDYTKQFFREARTSTAEDSSAMWNQYWKERMTRTEQIRQLEMRGSAALQGDQESARLFTGNLNPQEQPQDIYQLSHQYGIATATKGGARNDKRILTTVNKYLPEGTPKFKTVEEIPMDIAAQALEARGAAKAEKAVQGISQQFIPDAEKIFPDPMPLETGISELNYGRSYAVMDRLAEEAVAQSSKKSALLSELPDDLQKSVGKWAEQVNDEMGSFRAAGTQFASFRRDSALLNYNRRTNFDFYVGHIAPFAFWTTHSIGNWAIHSIDRPAMLATYLRTRKLFETAGLKDQNVPTRLKNNIRIQLPFVPDWMGEQFVNPTRFLLPFDGFLQPWEQAQAGKTQLEGKTKRTLETMLQQGDITEQEYNDAVNNQSGDAWDRAQAQAKEGGDNYDAMDFISMTMTPHAPLMWAYNAARGQKNEIGAFTPMSRTARNVATMMGVDDWANSPYNIEGRVRKWMGLPAYDKWDDYRVAREISNMAADGKYGIEEVNDAMMIASLVEAGKMTSADAMKENKVYAEATKRSNQEYAGGLLGTLGSIVGIPVHAYPTGEQRQRELKQEFDKAILAKDKDPEALANFFDEHPEYESRLALFKKPEERLQRFMSDNIWSRWNDMPKVNQDELKEQLGDKFADFLMPKDQKSFGDPTALQMQVWLKLMGGKPVGMLTADQEVMTELAHLKFTDPEKAWRVQTLYDMQKEQFPDIYKIQKGYFDLPAGSVARKKYVIQNPELKEYWLARRQWMEKNPDLAHFVTDNPKQIKQYERRNRNPETAVPTAQEIKANFSQPMQEILADWTQGQAMPPEMEGYIEQLAKEYGIPSRDLLGILTGH